MWTLAPAARASLLLAASLIGSSAWAVTPPAAVDPHAADDHHHHHASEAADSAIPATPWAIDAALGQGMRRVSAVRQSLAAGPTDPAKLKALGEELEAAVHGMFAECQLPPEPDAALHDLLAQVLDVRNQLGEGHGGHHVLDKLDGALRGYVERFDDPGFPAPPAK